MAAADVNGVVTYAGLKTLLTDLGSTLSNRTLTAAELSDLKTIVANLSNGMTTSSYLTGIMNSLVNGNAANAKWTGGAASSTALGNRLGFDEQRRKPHRAAPYRPPPAFPRAPTPLAVNLRGITPAFPPLWVAVATRLRRPRPRW